jgi:O-antigen/teichoic acid export membrane protein
MIKIVRNNLKEFMLKLFDFHMRELIEKSANAFILKVIAAGIMFVLNVVLARELGAKGLGVYFLGVTIVTIAAVVGRFGLDNALLKFIASYSSKNEFAVVKGVYKQGVLMVLGVSISVSTVLIIFGHWFSISVFDNKELSSVIYILAVSIIPVALIAIHAESLKGLKRIPEAVSTQSLFVPFFALIGVLIFVDVYGLKGAVWSYFLANIFTLILAVYFWNKNIPKNNIVPDTETVNITRLTETCVPMFWGSLFQVVNLWFSTLALGALGTSEDVGVFNVAGRTAVLTSFVLIAVNSIAAPKFSALFEKGDSKGLELTAKHTAKLATIMASPFLLVFVFFPSWVMGVFGDEFTGGALVLTIVAIGQFVNVSTGSVGYLLMMSGNEKAMRNNLFFCLVVNILLNLMLIPLMGVIGAAIATATVLILQNIIAFLIAWRRLGIVTLPFGVRNV